MAEDIDMTPSDMESEGGGGKENETLIIKSSSSKKITEQDILATCRFVNRRDSRITVCISFSSGGYSCGTLQGRGGYWDVHVRTGDCYCWDARGRCTPNCSLQCYPGKTYGVG